MIEINDRYIDVAFEKEPEYVFGDTGPDPSKLGLFAAYEDSEELIPESKWREMSDALDASRGGNEWLVNWILNQGREGSCVGNMETQGHMTLQAQTFGIDRVIALSAISAYQLIGSSPNSGANVADALRKGSEVGILPLDTPDNRKLFGDAVMPATGFYTKRPSGERAVARQFRFDETRVIRSVAGIVTAGLRGKPIGVGRAGHSILYLRPLYRNGQLGFLYVNSWGNWGFGAGHHKFGFGWDSLSMVRSSAQWAFSMQSIVRPDIYSLGTAA